MKCQKEVKAINDYARKHLSQTETDKKKSVAEEKGLVFPEIIIVTFICSKLLCRLAMFVDQLLQTIPKKL